MRVRRAATVTGAVAALVLLGGPSWADETPAPEPTEHSIDDSGLEGDPGCYFVPTPTDEPTGEVTAEPGESVTPEPAEGGSGGSADEPTDQPTEDPGAEPTDAATDEPTLEPTEEPTGEPSDEPTGEPTDEPTEDPGGYYVCMTPGTAGEGPLAGSESGGDPTLGSGTPQLPFSGAPVGRYAATGFALVLGGAATVLVARRRTG
jgi:hypothetical protein